MIRYCCPGTSADCSTKDVKSFQDTFDKFDAYADVSASCCYVDNTSFSIDNTLDDNDDTLLMTSFNADIGNSFPSYSKTMSTAFPLSNVASINVALLSIPYLLSILPLNVPSYMFSGFANITLYGVIPSCGFPGSLSTVKFSLILVCKSV